MLSTSTGRSGSFARAASLPTPSSSTSSGVLDVGRVTASRDFDLVMLDLRCTRAIQGNHLRIRSGQGVSQFDTLGLLGIHFLATQQPPQPSTFAREGSAASGQSRPDLN